MFAFLRKLKRHKPAPKTDQPIIFGIDASGTAIYLDQWAPVGFELTDPIPTESGYSYALHWSRRSGKSVNGELWMSWLAENMNGSVIWADSSTSRIPRIATWCWNCRTYREHSKYGDIRRCLRCDTVFIVPEFVKHQD